MKFEAKNIFKMIGCVIVANVLGFYIGMSPFGVAILTFGLALIHQDYS